MNVFKAILSWADLELNQFQEILDLMMNNGVIGCPGSLFGYSNAVKNLLTGFCSLTQEGRALGNLREQVERKPSMNLAVVPRVRDLCPEIPGIVISELTHLLPQNFEQSYRRVPSCAPLGGTGLISQVFWVQDLVALLHVCCCMCA